MQSKTQTALITGASGGIGLELAHLCAAKKINLILVARSTSKLESLAQTLVAEHQIECEFYDVDLSEMTEVKSLCEKIRETGKKIDILINNAGFGGWGYFTETDWEHEEKMIALNITALSYLSKFWAREMKKNGHGKIMNVASMAAFLPGPLMAVYYATKAYVLSLSEALRNELAGSGITVTTLCPGPTKTGFVSAAKMEKSKLFGGNTIPDAASVAQFGYNALMKGKAVVVPGWMNKIIAFSSQLAPRSIAMKIARSMQESKIN